MVYKREEKELVASEKESKLVIFLYNTVIGRIILKLIITKVVSNILGWYNNRKISKFRIKKFIKEHNLEIEDVSSFETFNDFFIRTRQFNLKYEDKDMLSVAESMLSIYNIDKEAKFTIKKQQYDLETLLGNAKLAAEFEGGQCLIFRLCVDNYHRYLYFDSGEVVETKYIQGKLHTVRPIAYDKYKPLVQNTRNYSILNTKNFGQAVFVEVGAIMVGKFTNKDVKEFTKAEERGYFELGGSTVVVLFKKGKLQLDDDLVSHIDSGVEIPVKYGEKIGRAV